MTTRGPDTFSTTELRHACETVGRMDQCNWNVISECLKCGLRLHVSLPVVIKAKGPDYSLWDRTTRCKKVGCGGTAIFAVKVPRGSFHQRIDNPFRDRRNPRA